MAARGGGTARQSTTAEVEDVTMAATSEVVEGEALVVAAAAVMAKPMAVT